MRFLPAALLFVAGVSLSGAASQPSPGAAAATRATAETAASPGTTRLTAVITDARGRALTGLKPADFELLVDGQPQTIDSVEFNTGATPRPRTFAFLLDEFHTAPGDSAAVRDGLLRFVTTGLRPADLAMVVKPLDSLTAIQASSDRDGLRQAIASFEGRKGDYTARTVFERNYMAQSPPAVESARAQIVTSALRAISTTLSQKAEGQPAIVLVSDGFARHRTGRDLPANLQSAVRVVNRANAPVYAFAPALTPPPAGDDAKPLPEFTALQALAADSGGALVTGVAELEPGLARMSRELDSHYVLTYRAAHGDDGRFHAVKVGIKRPGAQVRARTGYVAAMSAAMKAAFAPPAPAPMRVLRRSNLIRSWSGIAPTTGGRANVTLTWEPAVMISGQRSRASTVVITALAPDGTVLFDSGVAPVGDTASADVPDHAAFEAPQGAIRIDMKILDAKGVVLDTDARDVTVAAPRKGSPMIYPPAVLRARSAREFRQLVDHPAPAPTPTRDFRRTDRLLVRVPARDPGGDATPVTAVLLNRWRHEMRQVPPLAAAPAGTTQFDVPLAGLAPGEYTLRLSVSGPAGIVAEHITFRVTG